MKHHHTMPFGARLDGAGGAVFRLWAPSASRVELMLTPPAAVRPGEAMALESATATATATRTATGAATDAGGQAMSAVGAGWYETTVARAAPGLRYAFRIDGDAVVPDPASRHNPDDVHGASALVDPRAFDWPDDGWRGRPWHEAVIYELHVGCFTPEGTFAAAVARLDDLVALGVTAVELMPVADFPGDRGWGYDGVLPFAPESSYGHPDDLKRFVAQAHRRGLMVLLDVVYNHFGPDGNYLHAYAREFFNPAVATPWGAAINFGAEHSATVREFFVHNALYWLQEFRFDGLRIDAVHAMHDASERHFIDELGARVRELAGAERYVHLVLENHSNDAARMPHDADGRSLLADAQWNDDVHHAVHVLATGEVDGYYIDFAEAPRRQLARALAEGFAYQGEVSVFGGAAHGTPSAHLPPTAFVNSLQTHDQVGNRAFGDRLAQQAEEAGRLPALRALTACVLLAPAPPMLFMGEEYAATTPFQYFCAFDGELARAVTAGRRLEFGRFERFADPLLRDAIPDPNDLRTYRASKLDWAERTAPAQARMLALYTALLRCRGRELTQWLAGAASGTWTEPAPGTLHLQWPLAGGRRWHLLAQLADDDGPADVAAALPGRVVWASHADAGAALPPWSVRAALEQPR